MNINNQLIEAVKLGSSEKTGRLLTLSGCDPWARDEYGRSALMWAAYDGYEACVKVLLPISDSLNQDNDEKESCE